MLVNFTINKYDISYFDKFKDTKFMKYKEKNQEEINKTMNNYPLKIKTNFLKRSLLYYLIENSIIKIDDIIKKYNIKYPNKEIQNILDNLTKKDFDIFSII
jgi:esterase/lipase